MFIRAANSRAGTGFTGDVNTSFRQGRQDAFRDHIDNFQFALKADVDNNAENQRNVDRVAKNYGLDLQMDQAARQDAYNFLKQSADIDKQKLQTNIDFARDARLNNPEVMNEVANANATEFVAKAQTGAVDQQNKLSDVEFNATQKDIEHSTKATENQMKSIEAATGLTEAQLKQFGVGEKKQLIDIMNGLNDEDLITELIARHKERYPNSGETDAQLRSFAQNDIVRLRQEKAKQVGNKHLANMQAVAGNFGGGDTVNFNTTGNRPTGSKSSSNQEPKPVTVKTAGAVKSLSRADFEKVKDKLVDLGGGVYRDGNAIVVDNGRNSFIRYGANKLSDGSWETLQDLQARAIADARGTTQTVTSTITKASEQNN